MPTLLVENMVTVKVFKKGSQSGQLYLYLGERDYISSEGLIDDINGIAYLPNLDQMEGKLIHLPSAQTILFNLCICPSGSSLAWGYLCLSIGDVTKLFGIVLKNYNHFTLLKQNSD